MEGNTILEWSWCLKIHKTELFLSIVKVELIFYILLYMTKNITHSTMQNETKEMPAAIKKQVPANKCSVSGYMVLKRSAAKMPIKLSAVATMPNRRPEKKIHKHP